MNDSSGAPTDLGLATPDGMTGSMRSLFRSWPIIAAALVLLLPALINGYPLIYPDSAIYIHQGLSFTATGPWAMGYALFLRPFAQFGMLWPAIAAQALVASWAIAKLWTSLGSATRPTDVLALTAVLAPTTTLPWTIGWLIPDIFLGLLILSLAALVSTHLLGSKERDWSLIGLAVGCSVMHASSVLLLLSLSVVIIIPTAIAAIAIGPSRRDLFRLGGSLAIVVLLGLAANATINGVVHRRLAILTPYGWSDALAALNRSGLVRPYLDSNCSDLRYRLCQFADSLPVDPVEFLFSPRSPFATLGGWSGVDDEARRIVTDVAMQQPALLIKHVWRSFAEQIALLDARTEMRGAMDNPGVLALLEQDGIKGLDQYRDALQHTGRFPSRFMVSIHHLAILASIVALLICVPAAVMSAKLRHFCIVAVIAAGIILNDGLSASIAFPQDRFQARVIWLLPTAVVMLLLLLSRSGVWTSQLPGKPDARDRMTEDA